MFQLKARGARVSLLVPPSRTANANDGHATN